jgi:hypothetical protein
MSEIIADYKTHRPGEREVVDWQRPDGIHWGVPLVYLREVSEEDYRAMNGNHDCGGRRHFWEVSVD